MLQNGDSLSFPNADANVINNNSHPAARSGGAVDDLSSSFHSQRMSVSTVSSVENIPLTPPATPPLLANAANNAAPQLPKPEQWLGKVAQLTLSGSDAAADRSASTSSGCNSPPAAKKAPPVAMHARAYSLSSAETVLSRASAAASADGTGTDKSAADGFIIDWASLALEAPKPPNKNTNPFLSSPCNSSSTEQPIKTFEVQL